MLQAVVKSNSLLSSAESERLRVVLVSARNPLNIGAAARAMSNFGFRRLRVVNPFEVAFRDARSAVGASSLLASAEQDKTVAEAVADCGLVVGTTAVRHRELQHPVRRLDEGARLIRKRLQSQRVALLFGSEKTGLSNEDLSHCHWLVHIPTNRSMNLGQAVAVCLYELARTPSGKGATKTIKLATGAEVERFTETLMNALGASGYVKRGSEAATEVKIRRLVRRLNLESDDTKVWLGMLRQIVWKIRSEK